jgi:hypothetical protein
MSHLSLPPVLLDNERHAEMTVSCRDCDRIPKVPDAGKSDHGDQRQAYVVESDTNHIAVGRANAALDQSEITFVQGA